VLTSDLKGQPVVLVVEVTAGTVWGEDGPRLPLRGWEERVGGQRHTSMKNRNSKTVDCGREWPK
jgi:hypothetical protein